MAILSHCTTQIDEYSFRIWNVTSQETYDNAGINLTNGSVSQASLRFKKVNDTDDNSQVIDITSRWNHLFDCQNTGITINISEFTDHEFLGFTYFPDWMYTTTITYTYNGVEYSDSKTVGFRSIISRILYQQLQQADWKKELACSCDCQKYSSVARKFGWLMNLRYASELCLINEYLSTLMGLYKITQTQHEFS